MASNNSYGAQRLMPFIKIGLAFGLIYWLVSSGRFDLNKLSAVSSPTIWMLGLVLFLLIVVVNTKRWQLLLRVEDVKVGFLETFALSFIGLFFNFFMLGGVGGDVVKGAMMVRQVQDKKWFVGWSVLVDRLLGMLALLTYAGVTGLLFSDHLPEKFQQSFFSLALTIVFGLFVLIGLLILAPKAPLEKLLKIHPFIEKTLYPLFYFFRSPQKMLAPFLLSFLSQGLMLSIGVGLAMFIQPDLPGWLILMAFPFGFLATILPIAPAGIGVGQAAFFYLFDQLAGRGEFGVLVITFVQAVQFIMGLVGGAVFALYDKSGMKYGSEDKIISEQY